jgi:hypothetical protein
MVLKEECKDMKAVWLVKVEEVKILLLMWSLGLVLMIDRH